MNTAELKSSILKTIEATQNEQLLQTVYDFLKAKEKVQPGKLWDSLTEEQKNEVLSAYDESENEDNLVGGDELFK